MCAARASTCNGTDSDNAGIGASSITRLMTGSTGDFALGHLEDQLVVHLEQHLALSFAWSGGLDAHHGAADDVAVEPCSRALIAARSLKARSDGLPAVMSG